MSQIEFEAKVRIEIVGQCGTKSLRHVWDFERSRIERVSEGSWNRDTGMQPLVSDKQIPLRVGVTLSKNRNRNHYGCKHQQHAGYYRTSCARLGRREHLGSSELGRG